MKNLFVALLLCTVVTAFAQTSQPSGKADKPGTKAIENVKEVGEKAVDKTKNAGEKAVDKTKEVGGNAIDKTKEVGGKAVDKTKEVGKKAVDKTKETGKKAVDKTKEVGEKMKKDKPAKPKTPAKPKVDKKMKKPKMDGFKILKDAGIGDLGESFKSMGLKKEEGKALMGKSSDLLKKAMDLTKGGGNWKTALKDLKGLNKSNLKDVKGMLTKDQFKQYKPVAKQIWTAVKDFVVKALKNKSA